MSKSRYHTIRFLLVLSIGLYFPPALPAQPLDSLLSLALTQNPRLSSMEKSYRAALLGAGQSRKLPDTELGIGAFALPVQTRAGDQRFRLGVMQRMPWFGTLDAQEELSLAKAEPLSDQIELEALNILFQIKHAYYQMYELQETRRILGRNIELLESLSSLSLAKIEGGTASSSDFLRLKIKLRELRQRIKIINQQIQQAQSDLNYLINRAQTSPVRIQDSLTFVDLEVEEAFTSEQFREKHPALQYLNHQQVLARKAIALNDKLGKPALGFGAEYLWVDDIPTANFEGNGRDIIQLKASISLPLQRKPYAAKKQEELLKIEAFEQRKEAVEDQFRAGLRKALASHEEARLNYELYLEQVANTRAVLDILQANYSNNGSRFDELISLEMDLVSYEIQLLKAVVASHRAKAAIEKIIF